MQNKRVIWEISNLRLDYKNLEANVLAVKTPNNELQNRIMPTQTPVKSTNINIFLFIVIVVLILIVIIK